MFAIFIQKIGFRMGDKLASETSSLTTLENPSSMIEVRTDVCGVVFFARFQFAGAMMFLRDFALLNVIFRTLGIISVNLGSN